VPVPFGFATYIAVEGETINTIALRFGSLPPAITSLNRLPPEPTISEGQPLVIPLFVGLEPGEPFEVLGLEVNRGFGDQRIALTFDAGASAEPAASILDTLKAHDVRVTFFLTGKWAEENPDLVKRMAEEGHELANHTYSHPHLTQLEDEEVREQVLRTEEIIRDLTGQNTQPYMRPPYGDRNQHLLNLLINDGYISIYWTLDSLDSVGEPKTPEFLFQRITQPVDGTGNAISLQGGIVLMHVGSAPTAEALPRILDWYQDRGWEIVKVSEILQRPEP
jgi:peptidoglycan/xylan/chitin deacetylase (PgdA/CDA1 family)